MQAILDWLNANSTVEILARGVLLVLLAWGADRVTKGLFLRWAARIASRTKSTWDDRVIERNVFSRVANIAPTLVVYFGVGPMLGVPPGADPVTFGVLGTVTVLVRRVVAALTILLAALAASAFLYAVDDIYRDTYEESDRRPIKGYLQVVKMIVFIAALVVVVSILADQNPAIFLSGLGALTAVLMLVFRDTILSLVASLQIMSNDMIRIGDWVEMPQAHADGDVIDLALHTVRIQNWDKTTTTIPTHKFISESFKNWRGMSESGGRRIKRALHLDMNSVHFLSDEEIDRLSRYEILRGYMTAKREELREANLNDGLEPELIPETRRLTNLGTFRAYVHGYLSNHRMVHEDMTLLVRQLDPGPEGLPIEIYCFSNDTDWGRYEAFQADLFDHLIAILPEFGLRAFQRPTGSDLDRASLMVAD